MFNEKKNQLNFFLTLNNVFVSQRNDNRCHDVWKKLSEAQSPALDQISMNMTYKPINLIIQVHFRLNHYHFNKISEKFPEKSEKKIKLN